MPAIEDNSTRRRRLNIIEVLTRLDRVERDVAELRREQSAVSDERRAGPPTPRSEP